MAGSILGNDKGASTAELAGISDDEALELLKPRLRTIKTLGTYVRRSSEEDGPHGVYTGSSRNLFRLLFLPPARSLRLSDFLLRLYLQGERSRSQLLLHTSKYC